MAFNKNAFAASFLNQLTAGIEEREEKAEEFERQQRAAAERNASIVSTRKLRADEAAQIGKKAQSLGARKEHIIAAMSSGMTGISQLYQKLLAAANQKGVRKLSEDDIEAIINMPTVPPINGQLVDMSLQDFANKTFGVDKIDKAEEQEPSGNIVRKLFGLNDMAMARKRLQDTEYVEGMSIADINEAARQAEYTSLFPDLGFNLMDVEFYGPAAKGKFVNDFQEAASDAISGTVAQNFIQTQVNNYIDKKARTKEPATPSEIQEVRKNAEEYLVQEAVKEVIQSNTATYGRGGFFDDPTTLDLIRETMGDEFLIDQMNIYGKELEEGQSTDTQTEDDTGEEKVTEKKEADTEAKEEKIPAEKEEFSKVYYRNDEGDIVNGVPPRPTREFSNIFFGQGMGGDDIESIMKGEMPVPKYLRPSQWDELFGKFYNPDGTLKG